MSCEISQWQGYIDLKAERSPVSHHETIIFSFSLVVILIAVILDQVVLFFASPLTMCAVCIELSYE